mgnify:CR=1 FL=1|jgi:hypothetical protein
MPWGINMNNPKYINQTNFAFEEPIFSDINVDLPIKEKPVEPVVKKSKKKKIIVIGVSSFLFLLILLVAVVKMRKKPETEVVEDNPIKVVRDLSPIEERIENARLELEVADPSNQDLTFPPVDMGLRLDEKKR